MNDKNYPLIIAVKDTTRDINQNITSTIDINFFGAYKFKHCLISGPKIIDAIQNIVVERFYLTTDSIEEGRYQHQNLERYASSYLFNITTNELFFISEFGLKSKLAIDTSKQTQLITALADEIGLFKIEIPKLTSSNSSLFNPKNLNECIKSNHILLPSPLSHEERNTYIFALSQDEQQKIKARIESSPFLSENEIHYWKPFTKNPQHLNITPLFNNSLLSKFCTMHQAVEKLLDCFKENPLSTDEYPNLNYLKQISGNLDYFADDSKDLFSNKPLNTLAVEVESKQKGILEELRKLEQFCTQNQVQDYHDKDYLKLCLKSAIDTIVTFFAALSIYYLPWAISKWENNRLTYGNPFQFYAMSKGQKVAEEILGFEKAVLSCP